MCNKYVIDQAGGQDGWILAKLFFLFFFAFLLTKIKKQGGGPQVGEVTRLGRVTRLSIYCPLWGKSIKLGTVIVLVALIIFSYGPHSNMHGGRHIVPFGGEGSWPFCFGPEKRLKNGKKAG